MEKKEKTAKRRLEKKLGKPFFLFFCIISILLLAAIFYFYPQDKKAPDAGVSQNIDSPVTTHVTEQQILPVQTENPIVSSTSSPIKNSNLTPLNGTEEDKAFGEETLPEQLEPSTEQSQILSHQTEKENQCEPYLTNIENFFNTLDTKAYIKDFKLDEKSSLYFTKLIQRLVNNPPVVTGETDDLYTVLQNTAHFFRIIGKNNIFILKGILDRETATFEKTLSDFHYLTQYPDCLSKHFNLKIDDEALYLYSGFFLNTMGGRLYLFRRDSKSRMVVNFYAILIMDQATREGRNRYGIALNTSIDSLIDEIESSKIELKMREFYLDSLYDMKEKYQ